MKKNKLSCDDWDRIKVCVKMSICESAKIITRNIYDGSNQYCWKLTEDMIDDFKLLEKIEDLN